MTLYESGENYLETILVLSQKNGVVKSVDVATHLGFSKASVSRAMALLYTAGYIEDNYKKGILLTPMGKEKALSILARHKTITEYLNKVLNISYETAESDACRIEHIISQETFEKIKLAIDNL